MQNDKVQHLRNEPKLRFRQFNGVWSNDSLDSISEINPRTELPDSFKYISLESVVDGKLISVSDERKESSPSRAQRKLNKLDILYQTVRPYQKNNYIFDLNSDDYVASTGYAQIRCKKNTYYKFLYNNLLTESFTNKVLVRCTGTSYPAINSTELGKINLHYPILDEQKKIGNFLSQIDEKIELLDAKLENLKLFKRGLIQKIFNQEIRFANDDHTSFNAWKTLLINEIYDERTERGTGLEELLSVTMYDGVKKRSELDAKDNSSSDKSNYKIVKKNDMVYNSMRMWQGANGISNYDGIVSPAYTVMYSKKKIDHQFFAYLFKNPNIVNEFRKNSQGLTKDTWNLKYPQISCIKVTIPDYLEQRKISNAILSIDNKISIHMKEIKILNSFKKGLLQQMFL